MRPALSQVSSLPSGFAQDLEEYRAAGCRAVEVWLTKLEGYLESHSVGDLRELLQRYEVLLPVASFQGGLLHTQGESRRLAWELFRRRIALCRELEIGTIVVALDVATSPSTSSLGDQDLDRVFVSMAELAKVAAENEVRVAMEFQAESAFGNNLQTAVGAVAQIGNPWLGICLDAFHFYVGPSKTEDLGLLTRSNLFHVQLCDLADVPREFASDRDRILPGDGDIPLGPVIQRLRDIEYDQFVSVELLNPQLWCIPPRNLGEAALAALARLLTPGG